MRYYRSLDELPADLPPSAVTIGKFDGMHLGHRRVMERLRAVAAERGLSSTVLTFDRNPLSVLRPQACPENLTGLEQRRAQFEHVGIDTVVVIPFTVEFSRVAPEHFVRSVLVEAMHARAVLVGDNFRFGRDGAGTVATLGELGTVNGFDVLRIDPVTAPGAQWISSTRIRELLAEGAVDRAAELLGREPSVRGEVVRGEQRGRAMGYPTANLSRDLEGFIPADGVYAARLAVDGVEYPAAVSIGNNPTFEGVPARQVEAHVLDQTLDLYGKTVEVSFVRYIRPMLKFDGVDALIAEMTRDEARIREVLGVPAKD